MKATVVPAGTETWPPGLLTATVASPGLAVSPVEGVVMSYCLTNAAPLVGSVCVP